MKLTREKMNVDEKKRMAAMRALNYVPDEGILGVGTGSTVNYFIEGLRKNPAQPDQVISSSKQTTELLRKHGYDPIEANQVPMIDVYIDGADFVNKERVCIKGAGGAMTLEKILASMAKMFICIVDDSKVCSVFPEEACIPIEVLIEARSFVARKIAQHEGFPLLREGFRTDNGNPVLDVYELDLVDFRSTAKWLNQLHGIVGHGLFIDQIVDKLIVARDSGVEEIAGN